MVPVKPPKGDFRFRMIGGSLQLRLEKAKDLPNVLKLDEAFWAMTGLDIDSLRFDRRFLEFVDSDHDGQIRCDEVKAAVKFALDNFSDLDDLISGKTEINPETINPEAPGMKDVISCAELLRKNLQKSPGQGLTVKEISDVNSTNAFTRRNGDGIISCENNLSAELQRLIGNIIASGRSSTDRSGNPGVSQANVDAFEKAANLRKSQLAAAAQDPSIMVYGDRTAAANSLLRECESLLDSYFLNQAAGEFLVSDPERTAKKGFAADLMVPEDVKQALALASVADPGKGGRGLDFSAPLNPLYAAKLRQLAGSEALAGFLDGTVLSEEKYLAAKAALAPFNKYLTSFDSNDGLAAMTENDFTFSAETYAELRQLIADDLSLAPVISAGENLLKLALFQQNLLEFLNNFVALPHLFSPEHPSRLQMGKLVMDGRHFTLTTKVKNAAEHKKIIKGSNICVIYVQVTAKSGAAVKKQLLAAAVTDGTMRSLFIGKHGVFFDAVDGICDAVITDIVEQPVSIGEALKTPFFNFADFFSKQTEKIFNSRNAAMQKNLTDEMNKSPMATAQPTPKGAALPVQPANHNHSSLGNFSMLLMGGGIGVAALGSSVAFIAKSLQNVSFWTVLAVLAGIIVIFGGPSVVIALIKLFRRNLSRFLESCGCAVNRPMRMSRKMGAIFTFAPKRPKGEVTLLDPVDVFRPAAGLLKKRIMILFLVILLGCLCGVGAVFWYVRHLEKQELKSAAATETVEKVEKNRVENAAATPVENKTQTAAAENIPANNGGEKKEK